MITTTSARELLARASGRERVEPADARAGAVFERVTVGAESFFVKRLSASSDWIMRIAGDHVHRAVPDLAIRASWTRHRTSSTTPWWRWT